MGNKTSKVEEQLINTEEHGFGPYEGNGEDEHDDEDDDKV